MVKMTNFERIKNKEWEEFGRENPSNLTEILLENVWFAVCFISIVLGALLCK